MATLMKPDKMQLYIMKLEDWIGDLDVRISALEREYADIGKQMIALEKKLGTKPKAN